MTNYRRQFVPGGTYFFIVNLAERRPSLLTEHIDALRAALRYTQVRHPIAIDAIVALADLVSSHSVARPVSRGLSRRAQ